MIKSELRVRVQASFIQEVMNEDHFKTIMNNIGEINCYNMMADIFNEKTDDEFFQYIQSGKSAICVKFSKLVSGSQTERTFGLIEVDQQFYDSNTGYTFVKVSNNVADTIGNDNIRDGVFCTFYDDEIVEIIETV